MPRTPSGSSSKASIAPTKPAPLTDERRGADVVHRFAVDHGEGARDLGVAQNRVALRVAERAGSKRREAVDQGDHAKPGFEEINVVLRRQRLGEIETADAGD